MQAICILSSGGKTCQGGQEVSSCWGEVKFTQKEREGPTIISYKIYGLSPGLHGIHIHECADFSQGCISAGPHYNPFNKKHGGPNDTERHVGDLGNVLAGSDGFASGTISDNMIKLYGDFSVIGRSIMIHADEDDLGRGGHELSLSTGNSGARICCGEIKNIEECSQQKSKNESKTCSKL